MTKEEEVVYDLCVEIHAGNQPAITDATYERAKALIGERGIFEVLVTVGHYRQVS